MATKQLEDRYFKSIKRMYEKAMGNKKNRWNSNYYTLNSNFSILLMKEDWRIICVVVSCAAWNLELNTNKKWDTLSNPFYESIDFGLPNSRPLGSFVDSQFIEKLKKFVSLLDCPSRLWLIRIQTKTQFIWTQMDNARCSRHDWRPI
jgi:hypothetical protein